MARKFKKDERYRPIVTVVKVKKDVPTVLKVSGRDYVLRHKDQFKGARKNEKVH